MEKQDFGEAHPTDMNLERKGDFLGYWNYHTIFIKPITSLCALRGQNCKCMGSVTFGSYGIAN